MFLIEAFAPAKAFFYAQKQEKTMMKKQHQRQYYKIKYQTRCLPFKGVYIAI